MSMSSTSVPSSTDFNTAQEETFREARSAVDEMLKSGKGGTITMSGPSFTGTPGDFQFSSGTVQFSHEHASTSSADRVASEIIGTRGKEQSDSPVDSHKSEKTAPIMGDKSSVRSFASRALDNSSPLVTGEVREPMLVTTYRTSQPSAPVRMQYIGSSASYAVRNPNPQRSNLRSKLPHWKAASVIGGCTISGVLTGIGVGLSGASTEVAIGAGAGGAIAVVTLLYGIPALYNQWKYDNHS